MGREERKGNRKKRDNFPKRVPDLGYYFIVTDTNETESNYLYGLRDSLPMKMQGRIVIKVLKAKTDSLIKVCKEQAAMELQYGEPWIVFDRDRVVKFDQIIAEAKYEGINVGWSNPCIEIWFDTYFGKMHNYQDSVACCKGFAHTFESKTGHEYQKSNKQIYTILTKYGDESEAIKIANNRLKGYLRDGVNRPTEMCPCTTVQQLIGEIKEKIEAEHD